MVSSFEQWIDETDVNQGLWDAQKNIRALRSTGGNVEAAIELIFSGGLDGQGAP